MPESIITACHEKEAFVKLEKHLLAKAIELYGLGFKPKILSPSQMNAVADRLRHTADYEKARQHATGFLTNQLKKLIEKKERTGKVSSWLTAPVGFPPEMSLGQTLIDWITNEVFLGPEHAASPVDRLAALRRFWSNVLGQYRFRKTMGYEMPFEKEEPA